MKYITVCQFKWLIGAVSMLQVVCGEYVGICIRQHVKSYQSKYVIAICYVCFTGIFNVILVHQCNLIDILL